MDVFFSLDFFNKTHHRGTALNTQTNLGGFSFRDAHFNEHVLRNIVSGKIIFIVFSQELRKNARLQKRFFTRFGILTYF